MVHYEKDDSAPNDAGEAIDEIRRFVWAAADMSAAQKTTAARLVALRTEFTATREALTRANDTAHRLAQHGISINRSDMEALRADQYKLIAAMKATFGEANGIREKFWLGALGLGIAGGLIGGGIALATPVIFRGLS